MIRASRACLLLISFVVACLSVAGDKLSPKQVEFFESRIRPVLVEHCYSCHNSVDNNEGGFALDHRAPLLTGGDGGSVIVPGKPEESRLIAILKHEIDGLAMPEDGGKLSESIIQDFETWIRDGAPDPRDAAPTEKELRQATSWEETRRRRMRWWSFQPIREVAVPDVDDSHSAIDRFVNQSLAREELAAAPLAPPSVLVRRLYFALTGLPPAPAAGRHWAEQIEQASGEGKAARDRAVGELVDTLLSSHAFGERWARHWMDWVRYAESHGSEGDPKIDNAWVYRDYLIRALSGDVPVDQLIREHVCGDLLESPRLNASLGINESAIGASHWRMVFHGFSPTDALDERVRFTDDQINAFSKAFLGLTVSCARCHDHKFDAISQADYYALFGILRSCRPGRLTIDSKERIEMHRGELEGLKTQIKNQLVEQWERSATSIRDRMLSGEFRPSKKSQLFGIYQGLRERSHDRGQLQVAWNELAKSNSKDAGSDQVIRGWDLGDAADRERWFSNRAGRLEVSGSGEFAIQPSGDAVLTGIYPSGVYSHLVSQKYPARLTSRDLILRGDEKLWVESIGANAASVRYVVQDYPRSGTIYTVRKLSGEWNWQSLDLDYWKGDSIHIELATAKDAPLLNSDQPRSWFGVRRVFLAKPGFVPGDLQTELSSLLVEAADEVPSSIEDVANLYQSVMVQAIADWNEGTLDDRQAFFLDAAIREGALPNRIDAIEAVAELVARYRRLENEIPVPTRVPSLEETFGRDQPLMVRGSHKNLGDPVPRRFLEAVDDTPYESMQSGRRQLADDLLREDNPFVRRVIVNRVWHHLFGRGIVATPDNFGALGARPTHPELLDWLAGTFRSDGWSLKRLIRRMVMSDAWQRSSVADAQTLQVDPENQWLSHFPVRRLEAEAIRDSMLAVSGELDLQRFGSPVPGSSSRRSIYVNVIRNRLDPFLRTFDFPEPFTCVGSRDSTNVPAQSLALMNDPQVARYADRWAGRVLGDEQTISEASRIDMMFQTAFNRAATETESTMASEFLAGTRETLEDLFDRKDHLRGELMTLRRQNEEMIDATRRSQGVEDESAADSGKVALPSPIASWDFTQSLQDSIGSLDVTLEKGARRSSAGLVFDGNGFATTKPLYDSLQRTSLKEKTLEAWVSLDHTRQSGAGVMTLQSSEGRSFDAIVFGETTPQRWLAGSDFHRRTKPLGESAIQETAGKTVQIAIVYDKDGLITVYRNGKPYGEAYQSTGPFEFPAEDSVVSFGVRHFPAGGNRMLAGRVQRARLYDRALSAKEIAESASSVPETLSENHWIEQMSDSDRKAIEASRQRIAQIHEELKQFEGISSDVTRQVWTELARAIFCFKEFIYVR